MKNSELSDLFERMGTLLEIKGEIVFKVRAYFKAADNIRNLAEDIADLRAQERLDEIPGIGKTLQEKIGEYLDTGRLAAYEKLTREIPATLLDVVEIPSVGPKKAKLFFEELKIKDVDDLYAAAAEGKLLKLDGIREKTVANILAGIKVVREGQERMNLGAATRAAEEFMTALKGLKDVKYIGPAGSLRRGRETVRDIDLLVVSPRPEPVMDAFVKLPMVKSVNAHGETKSSVLTKDNVQVDLRVVEEDSLGAALLYFTGSKQFNVTLRQAAMKKKMKVNEYGVWRIAGKTEKCVASRTEEECLKALGLPYVPPELREDLGAADIFESRKPLPKLIEVSDIRGELHVHSTYSDGRNTIAEMARAAQERGYEYLAVSDHSYRLRVAGGVSPEDLKKKKAEIEKLNAKNSKFRILFGTELEIDTEGNLDYNNTILADFDFIIAAVHSGFEQNRAKMTKRLVKACQSKYVHAIAHPTGVHLGRREPYDMDFKEVCRAAADTNTFLEINSFPIRLDLNSANAYYAAGQGVKFVIDTDAHAVEHLGYMPLGVTVARRAWLTKEQVLNTRPLKEMLKMLKKS